MICTEIPWNTAILEPVQSSEHSTALQQPHLEMQLPPMVHISQLVNKTKGEVANSFKKCGEMPVYQVAGTNLATTI